MNPYQSLPLYSDAIVHQYRGKRRDENPPHIFAIAERAWINMGDERENQSILITYDQLFLSSYISADADPVENLVLERPRARRRSSNTWLPLPQTLISLPHHLTRNPRLYPIQAPRVKTCPPQDFLATHPSAEMRTQSINQYLRPGRALP